MCALSGGQKARVALARAAYSGCDIQLLDDPLSAVDPRVGRTLFDKCIGPAGVLAGSTRVLVTHQRQFLPQCDRVLVLRGGAVLALDTWQGLQPLALPELVAGAVAVELEHSERDEHSQSSREGSFSGRPSLPAAEHSKQGGTPGGGAAGDAAARRGGAKAVCSNSSSSSGDGSGDSGASLDCEDPAVVTVTKQGQSRRTLKDRCKPGATRGRGPKYVFFPFVGNQ